MISGPKGVQTKTRYNQVSGPASQFNIFIYHTKWKREPERVRDLGPKKGKKSLSIL